MYTGKHSRILSSEKYVQWVLWQASLLFTARYELYRRLFAFERELAGKHLFASHLPYKNSNVSISFESFSTYIGDYPLFIKSRQGEGSIWFLLLIRWLYLQATR